MNKPNLFNYATSELSQDAIICYILEWGRIENKGTNEPLYNLAINFIDSFFNKFDHISKPQIYNKIEIKKQYQNIDILCIINDEYAIIIEDKTNTKNHSNQLEKYLKTVKIDFETKNILPIFFKTGDQSNYIDVIKNTYKVYTRKNFLDILLKSSHRNHIIEDYTNYLQYIENDVNSYKKVPIKKWSWNAWKGFYIEIQQKLGEGTWEYVSNPSGGFLGFWWAFNKEADCHQYLQLEQNKFCFKIWVRNNHERSILRKQWYKNIIEKSKDYQLELIKPKRFGTGEYMTVCIINNEYRETKNGILDINATLQTLQEAKKLLESFNIE